MNTIWKSPSNINDKEYIENGNHIAIIRKYKTYENEFITYISHNCELYYERDTNKLAYYSCSGHVSNVWNNEVIAWADQQELNNNIIKLSGV